MLKLKLFSLLLFLAANVASQDFQLKYNTTDELSLTHRLVENSFIFKSINSVMHVDFSKSHEINLLVKSEPQLPQMSRSIIISNTGSPQLEVSFDSYSDIPNITVCPSKGNLKRNIDPASIPYEFGEVYQTDAFYPGKLAELSSPFIARDIRAVTVTVFPYQYNPVTNTLRVYENLSVKILNNPLEKGLNEIKSATSVIETKKIFSSLFLNGKGIEKYIPKEEIGELLIICPAAMDSIVQAFANWKIQKGIKTKVIHIEQTGFGVTNIKNYIADSYNLNPDLLYLLLIGDHEDIPAFTYGELNGEQLWSDSYYGQLTGSDFYPELFVGRFSGNEYEISNMIQRTIEYEKNPLAGDWLQNALGLASDLGTGIGFNGQADWEHMRDLRNDLLSSSYQEVHEFYDGSQNGQDAPGNPSASMVISAINNGVGLINYAGRGDLNVFNTSGFTSTDVQDLNNSGKYPLVISVACNHGTFSNGTCISEKWLRASKNGSLTGAIAACGSSILMSWAPPMKTQKEINGFISNMDLANIKRSFGGIFYNSQMKMLEQYPGSDGEEVMQTWILFGDPTVEFRNNQTLELQVLHESQIPLSQTALTVNCNVENALISISQDNVFLGKGLISGGATTISLTALQNNMPLTVTATKQNYNAYQGIIQVGDGPLKTNQLAESQISIFPNPASTQINLRFTAKSETKIQLINSAGQIIKSISIPTGDYDDFISIADIAKGIYQLVISNSENNRVEKLVIQ